MSISEEAPPAAPSRGPVFLLSLNGTFGALLWFGFCTDYEWDSLAANLLSPLAGAGIAAWSLKAVRAGQPVGGLRRWAWVCCLPSLLAGLSFLLAAALFCAGVLPVLFWMGEQSDAVLIQRASSPDGRKTAEVVFYPVGAYSGGNGRIEVFLKYEGLPLVRRKVYYRRVSRATPQTGDYLKWQDSAAMYVPEGGETIRPGLLRWQVPFVVWLPWNFVRSIVTG